MELLNLSVSVWSPDPLDTRHRLASSLGHLSRPLHQVGRHLGGLHGAGLDLPGHRRIYVVVGQFILLRIAVDERNQEALVPAELDKGVTGVSLQCPGDSLEPFVPLLPWQHKVEDFPVVSCHTGDCGLATCLAK